MNKKLIAKLLAVGMVLAMLPVTALAAANTTGNNNYYYNFYEDTTANDTKVEDEDITLEAGEAVISAKVINGIANVSMTEKAMDSIIEQLKEGEVLVLKISAKGASTVNFSVPAKSLVAVAEKTGEGLVIESDLAVITLPNEALKTQFKDATTVSFKAEVSIMGAYSVTIRADGKAVKDIKGLEVVFP